MYVAGQHLRWNIWAVLVLFKKIISPLKSNFIFNIVDFFAVGEEETLLFLTRMMESSNEML